MLKHVASGIALASLLCQLCTRELLVFSFSHKKGKKKVALSFKPPWHWCQNLFKGLFCLFFSSKSGLSLCKNTHLCHLHSINYKKIQKSRPEVVSWSEMDGMALGSAQRAGYSAPQLGNELQWAWRVHQHHPASEAPPLADVAHTTARLKTKLIG